MTAAQDSRAQFEARMKKSPAYKPELMSWQGERYEFDVMESAYQGFILGLESARPVARTPLSDEVCDRVIAALCPDFCDQRFPGDRPVMRQLARDAFSHGITQEKQG